MANPTVDGIEVAAQSDLVALEQKVTAIPAVATPFDPTSINAAIASLQSSVGILQSSLIALQATVTSLSVPSSALPPTDTSWEPRVTTLENIIANAKAAFDGSTVTATGTGGTTGGGTTTPKNDFPLMADGVTPDFVNATKPSPENSTMIVVNGKSAGVPYLIDKYNAIWQWSVDASGNLIPTTDQFFAGPGGYGLTVDGQANNTIAFQEVIVRQGTCYFTYDGGHIGIFESPDGPNTGIWQTSLPPAFSTTSTGAGGTTVQLPPMPADPVALSPAPGTTGAPVSLGPDSNATIASALAAVQAGGSIVADAKSVSVVYVESPIFPTFAVEMDGGGRVVNPGTASASYTTGAIVDGSSLADPTAYAHQLGGLVPVADALIRGFEVRGFGMQEAGSGGTGGVRAGSNGIFSVSDLYLHSDQMGLSSGGFATDWTATNCLLIDNGIGDGSSHNIYLSADTVRATFNTITSIVNPSNGVKVGGGHALKSRAAVTTINGGYFYASDATAIDIPDGSTQICMITGGTTEKKAGDSNHGIWSYGVESTNNGLAGISVSGHTLIIGCDSPFINTLGTITFDSTCKFLDASGAPLKSGVIAVSGGGTVTGLP